MKVKFSPAGETLELSSGDLVTLMLNWLKNSNALKKPKPYVITMLRELEAFRQHIIQARMGYLKTDPSIDQKYLLEEAETDFADRTALGLFVEIYTELESYLSEREKNELNRIYFNAWIRKKEEQLEKYT
jgi:hypothetical protein